MSSTRNSAKLILIRAATYASRIVCVCCTVWLGVIVMQSAHAFSVPGSGIVQAPRHGLTPLSPSMLLPQDGFWSFDNVGFDVQSRKVSADQLDEHFLATRAGRVVTGIDASPFIALAEANHAIRTDAGSQSTWTVRLKTLQAVLIATRSEPPMLVTATAAQRRATGWELFELGQRRPAASSNHLLSLPPNAIRQCSRRSNSGELLMELVQTDVPGESLLQHWRECGWEIRRSDFGPDLGFSYLCVQDAVVVYAWSASNFGPRTLMLSKSDDVATSPSADSKLMRPRQ